MTELLKAAINHYGAEHQERLCIEECAELTQAISKKYRGLPHNILEEVADVEFTLEYVKLINGICKADVERIKREKAKKLAEDIGYMKDNDIIKALEHCLSSDLGECRDCPFYEQCENDEQLAKYALDLINRQKAEIKQKDTEIAILLRKKEALRDEIERLDGILKTRCEYCPAVNTALKEFAERLKERKYVSSDWSHGEHPFVVEEVDIDEVLDEMTEDRK